MKFRFINALGKEIEIDVVWSRPEDGYTLEPKNLIHILNRKTQPIPYHSVASLAFEMYEKTRDRRDSEASKSDHGFYVKNTTLSRYCLNLGAYYQLLHNIGLPKHAIKGNSEERIKILCKDLNIKCTEITPMTYGYDLRLSIADDKCSSKKLFSILLKYGMTITSIDELFALSSFFSVSINGGSPFFRDKIDIDPKDKFTPHIEKEFKIKSAESPLQSFSLLSSYEERQAKEKLLIDALKQAFSNNDKLETLSNQINISYLFLKTSIEFTNSNLSLTHMQQEEIIVALNKLGISSKLISFEAPYNDALIKSGPLVSISLKKNEIEQIIVKSTAPTASRTLSQG